MPPKLLEYILSIHKSFLNSKVWLSTAFCGHFNDVIYHICVGNLCHDWNILTTQRLLNHYVIRSFSTAKVLPNVICNNRNDELFKMPTISRVERYEKQVEPNLILWTVALAHENCEHVHWRHMRRWRWSSDRGGEYWLWMACPSDFHFGQSMCKSV